MATKYHNFGACVPQVGTGASGALEVLGATLNGGTIREEFKFRRLHSDLSGPETPAELQGMGVEATINFRLATVDEAVLTKVKLLSSGSTTAGTEGTPGTPGVLMGTSGSAFKLYLPSANENPWLFTTCVLLPDMRIKEGTESDPYELTFFAWRFIAGSAVAISGTTLYTRVPPA